MRLPGASSFLAFFMTAVGMAAALICLHQALADENRATYHDFQQLTGGLGLGPHLDLSACAFCFDPRVERECQGSDGPLPCGEFFCPHHICSVFAYR